MGGGDLGGEGVTVSVMNGENAERGGGGGRAPDVLEERVGERRGDRVAAARDVCVLRRCGDDGVAASLRSAAEAN